MGEIKMVHKLKQDKKDEVVEWGFDLTEVSSDEDFLNLLKKYGFKKVKSYKPSDDIVLEGSKFNTKWKEFFGDRFKEYHPTFESPEGIRITVEHLGGKGEDKGFLGYIGIKSPKSALPKLQSFLKEFRGSKAIKGLDFEGRRGIITYVKKETPFESGFIDVET